MKSNFLFRFSTMLMASALILSAATINAQTLKIKSSTITISGTTNVHPYTTTSTQASGELTVSNNQPTALSVTIPVKSIINGERLMDKKTHETFNEPKNPLISFTMSEVKSITTSDAGINVTVSGVLAMAGASKTVTLEAKGKEVKPGTYTFEEPAHQNERLQNESPTAMMGVMKVATRLRSLQRTFEGRPWVRLN